MKSWCCLFLTTLIALCAWAKEPGLTVSQPAPAFNLSTRSGAISLDSLRGKVVLLDFWASWCAPCRQSFPWMNSIQERYSSEGLVIIAVNLDKKQQYADQFLEKFSPMFTVAFDPSGNTAEAYDVPTMPSSFLIDRAGKIVYSHAGFDPRKTDEMEHQIKEACSK